MNASDAVPKCTYCGSSDRHQGICPSVKAMEYYPDGTLKRVELKTAADYPPLASTSPREWVTGQPKPEFPGATNG